MQSLWHYIVLAWRASIKKKKIQNFSGDFDQKYHNNLMPDKYNHNVDSILYLVFGWSNALFIYKAFLSGCLYNLDFNFLIEF